ncbi:MATE family efflux transporter [Pradoshia sp. D12]|uniref:MATE family efflux transporter n=1 Tax=Bacillaceae TaxID=186817 RepID=UPI00080AFA3B|nr:MULTISPECIES: MATE family efflux transporter [Bacillaceae]OCA89228.1 MATE family efflux transporter [Bacillus sp. FJAT-27986]QFK69970.1 MATE family efflux transporter [Pradoshia sp. D12]TPF70532.1 MATE family efflux transporter [Bacillus sp. D12]
MKGAYNLTENAISSSLLKLSVPIIATNFIQTTYGMVDMIWVGKLGSGPVAAIGTASFFVNLALALATMVSIGSGVKIAHCMGANKKEEAAEYIKNGFIMSLILAILYTLVVFIYKDSFIGFFELGDSQVERMAVQFLVISMIGVIFSIINLLYSMILNSMGNSKTPFRVYTIGFLVNMILDPFLIFGIGFIPGMGVVGAALATLTANIIVTLLFWFNSKRFISLGSHTNWNGRKMIEVIKMGIPITVQRVVFIGISIIIAKIIVQWGAEAIAVQKVGIQIESISYMTIGGLQGAIAAFIGQNYGANKMDRIHAGYKIALAMTIGFGLLTSLLFILFPEQLFSIFISEPDSIKLGADYMRILGYSQVFMCMELLTVGAFNGLGKTYIPPIFSITFTVLRIPMAILLSVPFGLNGVWMSIAISSLLKGVVLVIWFMFTLRKIKNKTARIHA